MRFPYASLNIVVDRSLCSDSCPHRQIMWPNEFWSGRENASIRAPPPSFPSLPTPPLWLTSLFVGYTRTVERRGFVFCSGKIFTYIARRGSTSFRRETIGSASPSGKLDPRAGGREVRIGSAFRLNVRRQVYLSRCWDRFSDFGFGFSMLGFNLVGIWLTSNDDLFSFFFKYRSVVYWTNQVCNIRFQDAIFTINGLDEEFVSCFHLICSIPGIKWIYGEFMANGLCFC